MVAYPQQHFNAPITHLVTCQTRQQVNQQAQCMHKYNVAFGEAVKVISRALPPLPSRISRLFVGSRSVSLGFSTVLPSGLRYPHTTALANALHRCVRQTGGMLPTEDGHLQYRHILQGGTPSHNATCIMSFAGACHPVSNKQGSWHDKDSCSIPSNLHVLLALQGPWELSTEELGAVVRQRQDVQPACQDA
jgi:hypothetical protein